MEFFRWIGGVLKAVGVWWASRDAREDKSFNQSLTINDRLSARVDKLETQQLLLVQQNAKQAVQIEECQSHHEECEEDRVRLSAQIAAVNSKVNSIETKLLPEPK